MSIGKDDRGFYKSTTVTDTPANGGYPGRVPILPGVMRNIFDFVTAAERSSGVKKRRKMSIRITKPGYPPESALDMRMWIMAPTSAGDRKMLTLGTETDIQGDFEIEERPWFGVGSLSASLAGAETQIAVDVEVADLAWEPGGSIWIADCFKMSQTVDAAAKIGDSVVWSVANGEWEPVAYDPDYTYPKGFYIGNGTIITAESGVSNTQQIPLAENLTDGESIGTGDGASSTPALSTLANVTNGLWLFGDKAPVITATASAATLTVKIGHDGICTGNCTAGEINPATGAWITPITWSSPPDNATPILATYRDKPFSYSGLVVTLDLGAQVANAMNSANTFVSGIVSGGDCVAHYDNFSDSSAGGIFDEAGNPIQVQNDGVETDTITISMTSGTAFSASGVRAGNLGTGNTSSNFAPINPATGTPYFTLPSAGWTGSPQAGDELTFDLHVGAMHVWWLQDVPALTDAAERNVVYFLSTNE